MTGKLHRAHSDPRGPMREGTCLAIRTCTTRGHHHALTLSWRRSISRGAHRDNRHLLALTPIAIAPIRSLKFDRAMRRAI